MMRTTILFGGTNKERLVSVASAQALHLALPDADLWFWDVDDTVHPARPEALLGHARPFEEPFRPGDASVGEIGQALDQARAEDRLLVLGLHGGRAENGELQVMCETRGIPFIVAVNCFDGAELYDEDEVRQALDIGAHVPIQFCDARHRGSSKQVLVCLLEYLMLTARTAAFRG